jgi:hypothetical protein
MATRRSQQVELLSNTAVTGTNTYTSKWMDISYASMAGGMFRMAGTATGTLTIEVSYEATQPGDPSDTGPDHHKQVSILVNSAVAANIAISGPGNYIWETGLTNATWIRIKYVNATNTGTMHCHVVAKTLA